MCIYVISQIVSLECWDLKNLCKNNNCVGEDQDYLPLKSVLNQQTQPKTWPLQISWLTFGKTMKVLLLQTETNNMEMPLARRSSKNILYAAWKPDPDIFQQCVRWLSICSLQGRSCLLYKCASIYSSHIFTVVHCLSFIDPNLRKQCQLTNFWIVHTLI